MLLTQLKSSDEVKQGHPNTDDVGTRAIVQWVSIDEGNDAIKLGAILEEMKFPFMEGMYLN